MDSPTEKRRILCVDDETAVLSGLRRNLGFDFDVAVAESAAQARTILENDGVFAVVVSDMRMPEEDGVSFLRHVSERWPNSSRILLTGQADVPSAVAAVNEGRVFRFLTKPCPSELLLRAVSDGVRQYDLIETERVLLDQTLRGTINVMVEAIGLVRPSAAQPLHRSRRLAQQLCRDLRLEKTWDIDVAYVLSHIATLTLPPDILSRLTVGDSHELDVRSAASRCNVVAQRLAVRVPRLEPVRDLLRKAGAIARGQSIGPADMDAWILRVCIDYGQCLTAGLSPEESVARLLGPGYFWPASVAGALQRLLQRYSANARRAVTFFELSPGMILVDPIVADGILLVPADTEVTEPLIERLGNFVKSGRLNQDLFVREAV